MSQETSPSRERFSSRMGFLLISAGCAVGLGNVWRFPYITGEYGGAAFIVLYLVFLALFALPILVMEFSIGRASQKGAGAAFEALEPKGSKWHRLKWLNFAGTYILMMFYTTVAGWLLAFTVKSAQGLFVGLSAEQVAGVFSDMLANPGEQLIYMALVVVIGLVCTSAGLKNGVERVSKAMMSCLFVILVVLVVRAVTLPGAGAGLAFYLIPDFSVLTSGGIAGLWEAVYAAMGQAFFTLSIGIGAMMIFGSYIDKDRSLPGETMRICLIDTFVAIMAGLIIFPACFAFGVEPGSGPALVFITLPSVFEMMPMGQLWCTLFFLFMTFAALSTVIAVFEAIMAFTMDSWGWERRRAVVVNGVCIFALSLPCLLGFNVWSDFTIPGIGDIQSIEDFVVSNNLLPIGGMCYLLFCTRKKGWGFDKFLAEADAGTGLKFPAAAGVRIYISYVLPILIAIVLIMGWLPVLCTWFPPLGAVLGIS
ncbi:MAG: sodium-dependent transporter [Coriobacteriia bacterium]|nr:sodium-dependent transporter [Coriobacteriia bacterium]